MKYWLKQCPKCHGDLREDSDPFGSYIDCMQCGFTANSEQEAALLATGTLAPMELRIEEPQHEVAMAAARKAA